MSNVFVNGAPTVHGPGWFDSVVRPDAPEVGVVLEQRRSASSDVAVVVPSQQTLEPGGEVGRGRDLDLVRRCAEHGAPARRAGSISSGSVARSVTTGEPAEAFQCTTTERVGDGEALVALGVERRDAPVVGAVGDRPVEREARAVDDHAALPPDVMTVVSSGSVATVTAYCAALASPPS